MPIFYNFASKSPLEICHANPGACIISNASKSEIVAYFNIKETLKRLISLRKKRKLSIIELSKVIRISEETLLDIESGHSLLDVAWLNRFSEFYEVTIEYLLAEDVQPEQLTLDI